MRKERHQKLFNDKFMKNYEKITCSISNEISNRIWDEYKLFSKKNETSYISNIKLENILKNLGLYLGVFYIKPHDVNSILDLNLEGIHQSLSKLDKQNHKENDWAYDNNEFQKVFVVANDGNHAIVVLSYNDSWSPLIVDNITTEGIFFEGNMGFNLREKVYS